MSLQILEKALYYYWRQFMLGKKKIKLTDEEKAIVIKKRKKRKKITKFFITLIILACFATTLFFAGWINPYLESNEVAIITNTIRKTTTVYNPATFLWDVTALVPGNISINIYDTSLQELTIDKDGKLPSGDFYARFVDSGTSNDFDYTMEYDLTYTLTSEGILLFSKDQLISPSRKAFPIFENFPFLAGTRKTKTNSEDFSIYTQLNKELTNEITKHINSRSSQEDFAQNIATNPDLIADELVALIGEKHPEIKVSRFTVYEIKVPDYQLYSTIKEAVQQSLKTQGFSDIEEKSK